jgi:hypothetical protein
MISKMERDQTIGAMMPRIVYPNGDAQELCKMVPAPYKLISRRFFPSRLSESGDAKFKMMDYDKDMTLWVPYLSGCFMALRMSTIMEVGMFDERFFMYPEDIDLSRRIAEKYDTIYWPNVTAVHRHEQASRKSLTIFGIHVFNMCKYFNKWGWIFDTSRTRLNNKIIARNKEAIKKKVKHYV